MILRGFLRAGGVSRKITAGEVYQHRVRRALCNLLNRRKRRGNALLSPRPPVQEFLVPLRYSATLGSMRTSAKTSRKQTTGDKPRRHQSPPIGRPAKLTHAARPTNSGCGNRPNSAGPTTFNYPRPTAQPQPRDKSVARAGRSDKDAWLLSGI